MSGYRDSAHCIQGFNLLILDIDDGNTTEELIDLLLGKYTYLLYHTKRSTEAAPRFRVIMPMSHVLKLNESNYAEFMQNVYSWLPFSCDEQTSQRSRKWLTCKKTYSYNSGELIDVLPFIPKTKEAEKRKKIFNDSLSLSNLERWFVSNSEEGNRSNQLIKYGLALVDANQDLNTVQDKVISLNNKLPNPLPEIELLKTIMVTVANRIHKRDTQQKEEA